MGIRIRVSAVIIKDGSILLVRHEKEGKAYWLLPGGGVEQAETLSQALKREIVEEVSLEVDPLKLLFVSESISSQARHILHLSFLVRANEGKIKMEKDERLKGAQYFKANELKGLKIYPDIKNELINILQDKGEYKGKLYLGNRFHD
ncbi:MAG: NUDIX domain-containing protein [Actinobacteria bacterium]|nr:MAG: NUDIX domain-containing protein [Actinomycetota bacterium]